MTRALNSFPFESSDAEPHQTFNILIAYQNLETGKHAKNTYDFLVKHLGADCQFTNEMWKFEVLSIPHLQEIAAKDAAMADIIMISCDGTQLPPEVSAWIERWLGQPHHAFALVALFDSPGEEGQTEVRSYLAGVAKRGEMEFFAQPDAGSPATNPDELFRFQRQTGVEENNLPTLIAYDHSETIFPRWGIKE